MADVFASQVPADHGRPEWLADGVVARGAKTTSRARTPTRHRVVLRVFVCAVVLFIALGEPGTAGACPCSVIAHALIWKSEHLARESQEASLRTNNASGDWEYLLLLALGEAGVVAIATVAVRRRAPRPRDGSLS